MSVYLVSYAKRMLYFEQPTDLLARRHHGTIIRTYYSSMETPKHNTFDQF